MSVGWRHDSSASASRYCGPGLGTTETLCCLADGGKRGRPAKDNRLFLNAVFWILRTGAPWRDLPPDYGGWKNTHRRFCRWRDRGVWEPTAGYGH